MQSTPVSTSSEDSVAVLLALIAVASVAFAVPSFKTFAETEESVGWEGLTWEEEGWMLSTGTTLTRITLAGAT